MDEFWWINLSGMLFLLAITPGPNNLILLRAGAGLDGLSRRAAVLGIQSGSLFVLCLSWLGWHFLEGVHLLPAGALDWISRGMLVLLAVLLILGSRSKKGADTLPKTGVAFAGLMTFQLANPKSWLLAVSVIAFLPAAWKWTDILLLLIVFSVIPLFCQIVWLIAGKAVHVIFHDHHFLAGALHWGTAIILMSYAFWV